MEERYHRVVCTRHLDDTWTAQAREHHILLESHDFLSIRLQSPESFREAIQHNIAPFVFTSGHAVKALAALEEQIPGTLQTKDCFCIAGNTQSLAAQHGFHVLATAIDARELAHAIVNAGAKQVMHCSAASRRQELSDILRTAGVEVSYCEVYQKAASPKKLDSFDGLIFYSPSQIDSFLELNALPDNTPAFCIGTTTAAHLVNKGHTNIFIAPQSNTESILHFTYQYFNQA